MANTVFEQWYEKNRYPVDIDPSYVHKVTEDDLKLVVKQAFEGGQQNPAVPEEGTSAVHYAVLYLDTSRRIKIFNDGASAREQYVTWPGQEDVGWCLKEDDAEPWEDEQEALSQLAGLAMRLAKTDKKPYVPYVHKPGCPSPTLCNCYPTREER